jgi:hypothetical protein
MNDHDLDLLGRRAAAALRADADAVADSRAALDRLLASPTDTPAATTVRALPLPAETAIAKRRRLGPWAAAAAVFVVLGIAWLSRSGAGTIDIVGPGPGTGSGVPLPTDPSTAPSGGTAAPTSDTAPASTPSPTAPPTQPAAATSAPGTSAPTSTVPATPVGSEAFALLAPPPGLSPPALDTVPRLLPTAPTPDPARTFGGDTAAADPTAPVLSQLWTRADDEGTVTAVVHLRTRPAPAAPNPNGAPIEVAGWPSAVRYQAADGFGIVTLVAPMGIVDMWSAGLAEADLVEIAGELTASSGAWRAPTLDQPGWVAIDSTWTSGGALRSRTTLDREGDIDTELRITRDIPLYDAVPLWLDGSFRLVDVGGDRALAFGDGVSGLAVLRADGTTVLLGSRDPDADLVAVAESLVEVDQATWDAAAELTVDDDGCLSLFC